LQLRAQIPRLQARKARAADDGIALPGAAVASGTNLVSEGLIAEVEFVVLLRQGRSGEQHKGGWEQFNLRAHEMKFLYRDLGGSRVKRAAQALNRPLYG